jgi:hydroxymethylpyrimidine/phosphomethylpyrimidine kinase
MLGFGAPAMTGVAVCTIGSTDPWNAAGLGLDVRALAECGVRPLTVVAGVTAQDAGGVLALEAVGPATIAAQFAALRAAPVGAYRVGALLDVASIGAVAAALSTRGRGLPVVYDPVLAPSGGGAFADGDAQAALLDSLLPQTTLLTPNLAEAECLTGVRVANVADMEAAAQRLCARGAAAVLVKGGHLAGDAVDVLVHAGGTVVFEAPRLAGSLRGTGCLLACAVAAALAHGESLPDAVARGRAFVRAKFATAVTAAGMRLAY